MNATPARPATSFCVLALAGQLSACTGEPQLDQPVPLYGAEPIEYPITLWDEGIEGTTLVRLRVTDTGVVDSVEVLESAGHAGLDSAAVAGARQLRFEPGRRDGKRIRMWATLPIRFSKRPRTSMDP